MVWPDERWLMLLMVGQKEGGRERRSVAVLIVQHIIYCTHSFESQRTHTDASAKRKTSGVLHLLFEHTLVLFLLLICF